MEEYIGPAEPRPASFIGALASLLGLGPWQRGETAGTPNSAPGPLYNALGDILGWLDYPAKGASTAVHYGAPLAKAAMAHAAEGGLPLAAGMVKWGQKTHPQDFLARAMDFAELEAMQKAKQMGVPYEASGTFINPVQQGTYGNIGAVFDLTDPLAVKTAQPRDIYTHYKEAGPSKTLDVARDPSSLPLDLENLYKDQGKAGQKSYFGRYNEAVVDWAHPGVEPAGVMLPKQRPENPGDAAEWDKWLNHAKSNDLPVFVSRPDYMGKTDPMFDRLQENPMVGTWNSTETKQGIPAFWSNLWR